MENVNKTKIADLEANKNIKGLEEAMTEAEGSYDMETAELVKQALDRVNGVSQKIDSAEEIPEATEKRVEDLGGSKEVVEEKLGENTSKMEDLKEETHEKVKNVEMTPDDSASNIENSLEQETLNEKIQHLQEEIEKEYEKLRDIESKKGDHAEELENMIINKGYAKERENIKNSLKFNNQQIEKALFNNKEKTINYLQKVLESASEFNDRTKREIQDFMDNFNDKKSDYESGRQTVGSMAWKLIEDNSEKIGNLEIGSLASNKVILNAKMDELQKKIDSDPELAEIKQRHQLYNELNQPELQDTRIKTNITNLKKEIENLQKEQKSN